MDFATLQELLNLFWLCECATLQDERRQVSVSLLVLSDVYDFFLLHSCFFRSLCFFSQALRISGTAPSFFIILLNSLVTALPSISFADFAFTREELKTLIYFAPLIFKP